MKNIDAAGGRGLRVGLALASGLLLAVARIIVSFRYLEPVTEMYAYGAVLPVVFHCVLACVCLAAVIGGCLSGGKLCGKKEDRLLPAFGNPSQASIFLSMFTGFMMLAYAGILLYGMAKNGWAEIAPLIGRKSETVTLPTALFALLFPVSAIPAALYFFRTASYDEKNVSEGYTVVSVMPVLWFVLSALHQYFASEMALNSPVKVIRVFAILALLFYAVHESRVVVCIGMPRVYFASAYLAVLFTVMQTVSEAVFRARGLSGAEDGYIDLVMELVYVGYIVCRLMTVKAVPAEDKNGESQEETAPVAAENTASGEEQTEL